MARVPLKKIKIK